MKQGLTGCYDQIPFLGSTFIVIIVVNSRNPEKRRHVAGVTSYHCVETPNDHREHEDMQGIHGQRAIGEEVPLKVGERDEDDEENG